MSRNLGEYDTGHHQGDGVWEFDAFDQRQDPGGNQQEADYRGDCIDYAMGRFHQ